jgi:hypothetical protein
VVVHHLSERQDYDDHLDAVSSSTGFTGAADTILILANGPQGPTLYGKGRDIEEIETALRLTAPAACGRLSATRPRFAAPMNGRPFWMLCARVVTLCRRFKGRSAWLDRGRQ